MKSLLSTSRPARLPWALALVGTSVVLVAVVLPPLLPPGARASLMAGFHTLCHQLPDRSFAIDRVPLAACHRCTGIYAGLVLGVLALPFLWLDGIARRNLEGFVLLAAVLPAAVDWGGDVLGLWTNTAATRVVTGLWFGVFAGVLLARAVTRTRNENEEVSSTSRPRPVS